MVLVLKQNFFAENKRKGQKAINIVLISINYRIINTSALSLFPVC